MKANFNKIECCGCMACSNICPTSAITMFEDSCGYRYPKIDETKCINCGRCITVCNYNKVHEFNKPIKAMVAVSKQNDILMNSASGGIFSTLALEIVKKGGVAYGAIFSKQKDNLIVKHVRCEHVKDLPKLAGSKYVQSEIGNSYKQIKSDLKSGLFVLFSGTPCQVDGLKGYLGKDYENLICVDIICHGVPSQRLFDDYLKILKKECGEIMSFCFRDKNSGWDLMGHYTFKEENQEKISVLDNKQSSYYQLFLDSDIYRENCYTCKYAQINRCSDITIGDYWGIEDVHPSYLKENGGQINHLNGVSCLLINTEKALRFIRDSSAALLLFPSTVDNVRKVNAQLNHPSKKGKHRQMVLFAYKMFGYSGVEMYWHVLTRIDNTKRQIKQLLKKGK